MRRLALWLLPMTLCAGPARFARIGDFDGTVLVQLTAADDWQPARRNLPLRESSWLRTEGPSRVEVEFDDGNVLRLGPDSLAELSDYTRLSTGQGISLVSLDHGVAYFTGSAQGKDAVAVALPGAQVNIREKARLRFEARDPWSLIAASDGIARFSSPTAEFDLNAGQIVRLDPAHPSRFILNNDIQPLDTDRWCDERDQVLLSTTSAAHLPGLHYGLADLDGGGVWIQTGDFGAVWKPKVQAAWAPYRNGKWQWFDGLGYTWISDDPWGWLPYHYGRWLQLEDIGWIWAPGESTVFKPGDVYWLKSAKLVGWGPLAPGEDWKPPAAPRQYLHANTTYATYTGAPVEIDPGGFSARPKEPLAAAVFVQALTSPPFPAARLDAFRPALRAGGARSVSIVSDAAYDRQAAEPQASVPPPVASAPPAESPVVVVDAPPVEVPVEVDVPIPVYTGIIVGFIRWDAQHLARPRPNRLPARPELSSGVPVIHVPSKPKPDPDKPVK